MACTAVEELQQLGCLSICLYVCLFALLLACLSIYCLSVCLHTCLSVCLSLFPLTFWDRRRRKISSFVIVHSEICHSLCLSVYLSDWSAFVCLSIRLFACLSVLCQSVSLFFRGSVCRYTIIFKYFAFKKKANVRFAICPPVCLPAILKTRGSIARCLKRRKSVTSLCNWLHGAKFLCVSVTVKEWFCAWARLKSPLHSDCLPASPPVRPPANLQIHRRR